jgi:hypothetical protein
MDLIFKRINRMETTIEQFAEQYRVKTKRDECGDTIIAGKTGDIFDGYLSGLGVRVTRETRKQWNSARRQMEAGGFVIRQDADTEGIAVFDPTNKALARLALKLARVIARRNVAAPSPAQLAQRAAFAQKALLKASQHEQEAPMGA